MHYYQFNIGDYRRDTTHLTPIEHYIYRELIDWQYLDEVPISQSLDKILRKLKLTKLEENSLVNVLDEFFEKTEEGYVHHRIFDQINSFKALQDASSRGGKASAEKRKKSNGRLTVVEDPLKYPSTTPQPTNNHKPITNNHEKEIFKEKNAESFLKPEKQTLPDGWQPSPFTVETVQRQWPNVDLSESLASFIDYQQGKGVEIGHKGDWEKVFIGWCRNANRYKADKTVATPAKQHIVPAEKRKGGVVEL